MAEITSQPKVSIVIPTHNRGHAIFDAVRSTLSQTYKNIEVIVVDDCSTDKTEQTVTSISDSRIFYLRSDRRRGGADARNFGTAKASGELIAYLDSDDVWVPEKLETQVSFFLGQPDHRRLITYTGLLIETKTERRVLEMRALDENEDVADYLFIPWSVRFIQTSTLLMSTSFAKCVKFRSGLPIHQDWDFCIRAQHAGATFALLSTPLTIWRWHDRGDRLSFGKAPHSFTWLESVKELISERAYLSFAAHRAPLLFPEKPAAALSFILRAHQKAVISNYEAYRLVRHSIATLLRARDLIGFPIIKNH